MGEAKEFIERMSYDSCCLIWCTLLNSFGLKNDSKIGEFAVTKLIKLEPGDASAYVLHSTSLLQLKLETLEALLGSGKEWKINAWEKDIRNSWIWS